MKLTKREGDFDGFLTAKKVPAPIKMIVKNLVGGKVSWKKEEKDGKVWLEKTELGTFSNTKHPAFRPGREPNFAECLQGAVHLCAAWSGRAPEHLSGILAKFRVRTDERLGTARRFCLDGKAAARGRF